MAADRVKQDAERLGIEPRVSDSKLGLLFAFLATPNGLWLRLSRKGVAVKLESDKFQFLTRLRSQLHSLNLSYALSLRQNQISGLQTAMLLDLTYSV